MSGTAGCWAPDFNYLPTTTVAAKETSLSNLRTLVGPGVLLNPEQVWNMLKGRDPAFTPIDLGDYYYICFHLAAHW